MSVSLKSEVIDVAAEYAELIGDQPGAAVATFTGHVRGHAEGQAVTALELEHYPEMAQKVRDSCGALQAHSLAHRAPVRDSRRNGQYRVGRRGG